MKKLLMFLLTCIILSYCTSKRSKYIITIQWEGSAYYYHIDNYIIDSIKCIHFIDNYEEKSKHVLCGTYQITEN